MPKIQTLSDIIAEMNLAGEQIAPASCLVNAEPAPKRPIAKIPHSPKALSQQPNPKPHSKKISANKSSTKPTTCKPQKPLDVNKIANPALAELLQNTPQESLATTDRATNYLRWLAFYYLSKREHSKNELKAKLIAKDCDPVAVAELLDEFADKGYQSDLRTALMVVRESVRLGRGKRHIEQKLWQYELTLGVGLPYTLDELLSLVDERLCDGTILENDDNPAQEIDWLKLAVEARVKKYGNAIPKDPKEKARQLRFLQYRGFEMEVCFEALKLGLEDIQGF